MPVPFGKYLLQRKLAEGGMAEIFLASQAGPADFAKLVVVKRLRQQISAEDDFVRMFINEARLASRLSHPNVVQIFDLGIENGAHYLAMEYIHGEDLRSLAEQADSAGKRPPIGLVCRILGDVLAGLHYAHTRTTPDGRLLGLVHRDISPQNILVTYDGEVKIIDFGIAKATQVREGEQTQAGLLKGKYAYMSPEQTRGSQLDARSDVFSAGILLWELLTWRRLFKRPTDLATLVAVSDEPAPPMSLLNQEVPKDLDQIALRALSIDPQGRFATAKEFQAALEECIAQHGWEADTRALSHYMRDLFKDKLEAQEREAAALGARTVEEFLLQGAEKEGQVESAVPARHSGRNHSGRRELPLLTMPLQTLDQAQRPPSVSSPQAPAAPRTAPRSAVSPSQSAPRSASMLAAVPRASGVSAPASQPPQVSLMSYGEPLHGGQEVTQQSGPQSTLPTPATPPQQGSQQSRIGVAVAIGLIIGVVTVLLLQFFVF